MVLRVQEGGGSECRAVKVRIGVALQSEITLRETGKTSTWSLGGGHWANQLHGAKQMTAARLLVQLRATGTRRKA